MSDRVDVTIRATDDTINITVAVSGEVQERFCFDCPGTMSGSNLSDVLAACGIHADYKYEHGPRCRVEYYWPDGVTGTDKPYPDGVVFHSIDGAVAVIHATVGNHGCSFDDNGNRCWNESDDGDCGGFTVIELSRCEDCGAAVDSIIGCPDGAEVCQDCFDKGRH